MGYPAEFRYTAEHEWISSDGPKARIGITDFAQKQLGDIVFVELPAVGAELTAGQAFGTIESVKAVSEIFSPVSGRVTGINPELAHKPELLNSDPHGAAWLITAEVSTPVSATGPARPLMDAAAYERFLAASEEQAH